jgi:5-methylthioadenosine/S-adenosylhomocysteine deaminase
VIIRNATLLDFQDLSQRRGVDLRITDGRIAEIGPGLAGDGPGRGSARRRARESSESAAREPARRRDLESADSASQGEELIDASGMYVIPGLVNLHAHAAMTLLRGAAEDVNEERWFNDYVWMYERNLTPEDVYIGTLLGAAEMLLSGVTCVADHYFNMDRAFQAYRQAGMRADLSWTVFGTGEGWEEQVQRALEFLREYRDRDPRITLSLGPHSPYICHRSFLHRIADQASEMDLKMHIHVSETGEQVQRSLAEHGKTPVVILADTGVLRPGTILAHAYYATDGDLELIREAGAGVAHCAKTYLKFGDVQDFLLRALAAGVPVGLGTDGPCSNNTLSIFEAARDAAFIAKSIRDDAEVAPIAEVLPLVHRGGEILGFPGYGRIREGGLADLVLIDPATANMVPEHNVFANLLYSLNQGNIHTVIVDGRVAVRQGVLVNIDLREVIAKTLEVLTRITKRDYDGPLQRY